MNRFFLVSFIFLTLLPHSKVFGLFNFSCCKTNVIFIHPDGMSLSHWDAIRLVRVGSQGRLHFDKLPYMAVYRGTIRDQVVATSNAGGTIHAYGVKTGKDSFGMDKGQPIQSQVGSYESLMMEAQKKGISVALVQSGVLVEPGTAAFVAQVKSRKKEKDQIAKQVVQSGIDLIFAGGERYLLPKGVKGHFGKGQRKDELNLIQWAQNHDYTVIYDLKNFKTIIPKAQKVLGIFAHDDTYNDQPSSFFKNRSDYYRKDVPSIAEMTQAALDFLKSKETSFFIVIEEEGTDNFSNLNNTAGFIEAGKRADDVIGVGRRFLKKNSNTLLLTTSDSNAGGLLVVNPRTPPAQNSKVFYSHKSTKPIYPFSILWPTHKDVHGSIVVKAEGLNANKVTGLLENTSIYQLIRSTLLKKKILNLNQSPEL